MAWIRSRSSTVLMGPPYTVTTASLTDDDPISAVRRRLPKRRRRTVIRRQFAHYNPMLGRAEAPSRGVRCSPVWPQRRQAKIAVPTARSAPARPLPILSERVVVIFDRLDMNTQFLLSSAARAAFI